MWEECRETRVDDAWEFLVFGLAKTGTTKGEKDDTRGIDSPAVYFCPRQWRMEAGFQRTLSQRSALLLSYVLLDDVVPLINGELESFALRKNGGRNKEPTHRRFHDDVRHKCK